MRKGEALMWDFYKNNPAEEKQIFAQWKSRSEVNVAKTGISFHILWESSEIIYSHTLK